MEEKSELESKFEEEYKLFKNKIQYHIDKAHEHLSIAIGISEEFGIPMSDAGICELRNNYVPSTFYKKWADLDNEVLYKYDLSLNEYGYEGWEHSAIC